MGPKTIIGDNGPTGFTAGQLTVQTISIAVNGKLTKFVRVDQEGEVGPHGDAQRTYMIMGFRSAMFAAYLFARAAMAALLHFWH